jgi:lambda family phage portal protein
MSNLRIVDAHGRPIPRSEAENEGASYGRRMATWGTSLAGPNTVLWGDLSTLRSRVRKLTRNNPLAENGLESIVSNLIGTGIVPRWQIKDSALKDELRQLWSDWTEEADFNGVCGFYGLQSLAARSLAESGEVLARFVTQSNDTVPLQIQLIESDHLDESYETVAPSGNKIRMGIEFNAQGKRAAYWLFKDHPGETFLFSNSMERVRVPASEILHVFRPLRPGQMRGRPWLSSIIIKLHEIDQYSDAEIVRKKAAAMFGGFITEPPGADMTMASIGRVDENDTNDNPVIALEPGTFPTLPPGKDVRFSEPADVGGNYLVWIKQQLREIAAGMGITYEQLTGDLEGVNYSSIRAGLLEFRRRCEALQWHTIIFQLCQPVAKRWLDIAVGSGAIRIPGYFKNRRIYTRIDWRPQGWKWVDPLKDGMAAQLAVRCGFTSRSAVVAEQGYDSEQVDQQVASDNNRADQNELIYDSDPRKTQKSGTSQAAETTVTTGAAGQ